MLSINVFGIISIQLGPGEQRLTVHVVFLMWSTPHQDPRKPPLANPHTPMPRTKERHKESQDTLPHSPPDILFGMGKGPKGPCWSQMLADGVIGWEEIKEPGGKVQVTRSPCSDTDFLRPWCSHLGNPQGWWCKRVCSAREKPAGMH